MPAPTNKKTWQFAHYIGTPSGSQNLDQANAFVAAKNHMTSYALTPWTVLGSSDGTTGALDAVDRWTSGTVLTGGGGHAWILMEQAGWNGGGQVCWVYVSSGVIQMWSSPRGAFTGGSATVRPTAPDEQNIPNGNDIFGPYVTTGVFVIHSMMSTDGTSTRFFLGANNLMGGSYVWETIDQPTGGINHPVFSSAIVWGAAPNARDFPLCMTSNAGIALLGSNTLTPGSETYSQNGTPISIWNGPNEISGEHQFYDNFLVVVVDRAGNTPSYPRAIYGRIVDLWYTDGTLATGDGFPGDGSKQYICTHVTQGFGIESCIVWPWDGTVLVMG